MPSRAELDTPTLRRKRADLLEVGDEYVAFGHDTPSSRRHATSLSSRIVMKVREDEGRIKLLTGIPTPRGPKPWGVVWFQPSDEVILADA